ncbi:CesT family type III secretion system chaperone [Vibrio sp. PP-XX7]
MYSVFHRSVESLLQKYGINISSQNEHDVYLLTVENRLDIYLIGTQAAYLNLACSVGELDEQASADSVVALLAENQFSLSHPIFRLGIDKESRIVTLATQRRLDELDSISMYKLVDHFITEAVRLNQWLSSLPNRETPHRQGNQPMKQQITQSHLIARHI